MRDGEEEPVAEITERREVRVRGEEATFVFAAEPEAGRLVIREERDGGDDEELCALTIADREELSGFLQGLRRVLGVQEDDAAAPIRQRSSGGGREQQGGDRSSLPTASGDAAPSSPAASSAPASSADTEDDRREARERARARGQTKAFEPWTREEEQRLLAAVREGRDLDELAREHQRSRRALELRLDRLQT